MADLGPRRPARVAHHGVVHALDARRARRRPARRAARGRGDPCVVPRPHRGRGGVRRVAGVLRRGRPAGRGRGPDADAAAPPRARRPRPGRRAHLGRRRRASRSAARSAGASPTTPSAASSPPTRSSAPSPRWTTRRSIQNRCFLYHLIGNGTGEWRVPIGGMGAVTDALARAAVEAGAEIVTGAGVSVDHARPGRRRGGVARRRARALGRRGRRVLSGVAPWVLRILLGEGEDPETKPAGSQLKINFLLDRLPALQVGRRPGRRLRRHPPPRRGLPPARAGVRRRGRRLGAGPDAGRGLLPQPHRPLDPRRPRRLGRTR